MGARLWRRSRIPSSVRESIAEEDRARSLAAAVYSHRTVARLSLRHSRGFFQCQRHVKPVSYGALGNEVLRIHRIGFEFLSELANNDAHIFEPPFSISLPNGLGEVSMCEGSINVAQQALQNEKLLGGQVAHPAARAPYFMGFQVNRAIVKEDLACSLAGVRYTPQDGAHPRQKFP